MYTRLRHLPDFAIQRPTFLYRPRFPVGQIQKKKQQREKKLKETKYEINKHHQQACSMFSFILSFWFCCCKIHSGLLREKLPNEVSKPIVCGLGSSISFQSWNTDQVNAIAEYNFTFYFIFWADDFFLLLLFLLLLSFSECYLMLWLFVYNAVKNQQAFIEKIVKNFLEFKQ